MKNVAINKVILYLGILPTLIFANHMEEKHKININKKNKEDVIVKSSEEIVIYSEQEYTYDSFVKINEDIDIVNSKFPFEKVTYSIYVDGDYKNSFVVHQKKFLSKYYSSNEKYLSGYSYTLQPESNDSFSLLVASNTFWTSKIIFKNNNNEYLPKLIYVKNQDRECKKNISKKMLLIDVDDFIFDCNIKNNKNITKNQFINLQKYNITDKFYLYLKPGKKTKMYLIKGDKVTILDEQIDDSNQKWYFINYKGKKDLKMWIKAEAVDVTDGD